MDRLNASDTRRERGTIGKDLRVEARIIGNRAAGKVVILALERHTAALRHD